MRQRKILTAAATAASTDEPTRKGGKLVYSTSPQVTKAERLKEQPALCEGKAKDGGKIIVPATCSNLTKATDDVLLVYSFLSGKQPYLRSKSRPPVEYTLAADLLTPTV